MTLNIMEGWGGPYNYHLARPGRKQHALCGTFGLVLSKGFLSWEAFGKTWERWCVTCWQAKVHEKVAAEICGLSLGHFQRLVRHGRGPFYQVARGIARQPRVYRICDLARWMKGR